MCDVSKLLLQKATIRIHSCDIEDYDSLVRRNEDKGSYLAESGMCGMSTIQDCRLLYSHKLTVELDDYNYLCHKSLSPSDGHN